MNKDISLIEIKLVEQAEYLRSIRNMFTFLVVLAPLIVFLLTVAASS